MGRGSREQYHLLNKKSFYENFWKKKGDVSKEFIKNKGFFLKKLPFFLKKLLFLFMFFQTEKQEERK